MRIVQGLIVTAAAAVLLSGAARAGERATLPAAPDAGAVVGVGVICNTSDQAEQFVSLRQQGEEVTPAVESVNAQARQPRACGVAAIAFVPERTLATRPMGGKLVRIVRINVIAGYDGSGWQTVAGTVQYAIMEEQGEAI
ncbi:MAG TPA: hypothetical protein VFB31_11910 [Pseudolabrys sp.]|nr:hypothetical protein [Pseudolabrys sp.]